MGISAGIAACLIVAFLLGGALLPRNWSVEQSVLIDATPAEIQAFVATPMTWSEWTVWNDYEFRMTGPQSGTGAGYAWGTGGLGSGNLHIFNADELGIDYVVRLRGLPAVNGQIRYTPDEAGTVATWGISGDLGYNPVFRYFSLMTGNANVELAKNLALLKERVEDG
jgi:hypothetical protein